MVHTRPRYGGGKTMENADTFKEKDQEVRANKTMEQPNDMENGWTKWQECFSEKVPQGIRCDLDSKSKPNEEDNGSFQHFQDSSLSAEYPRIPCGPLMKDAHSSYFAEEIPSSSGNYAINSRKERCSSNVLFSIQADKADQPRAQCNEVRHLMAILKFLGIDVTLKRYVRSSVTKDGINDKNNLHPHSIDLSAVSTFDEECNPKNTPHLFCKNLFLKDRKGQYFLVIAEETANVDLKCLKQQLKANRNLSFADASATSMILGLRSGEITPLVVMRKSTNDVRFILHESLGEARKSKTRLAFHPLDGRLQVDLTVDELITFFNYCGKCLEFLSELNIVELQQEVTKSMQVTQICKKDSGNIKIACASYTGKVNNQNGKKDRSGGISEEKDAGLRLYENSERLVDNETIKAEENDMLSERLENNETIKAEENDMLSKRLVSNETIKAEENDMLSERLVNNETTCINIEENEMLSKRLVNNETINIEEKQNDFITSQTDIFETIVLTKKHQISGPSIANRDNVIPNRIIGERKGKLKSFLNKNARMLDQSSSNPTTPHALVEHHTENKNARTLDQSSSNPTTPHALVEHHTENVSEPQSQRREIPALHMISNDVKKDDRKDEDNISGNRCSVLPEISHFYTSLSKFCILYHETDLRSSGTMDIGPSLGCKCILLKDKRKNYYFVITHEFYELDYGRLKSALKPRKKLEGVEMAEVLDNLGVQPNKITPFSCVSERAMSRNIKVFITEKIQPPEIILCIKHPYAEGLRLIMSSSELQRYLSNFILQIGTVQEKVWPPKFNRMFDQFSDKNKSDSLGKAPVPHISSLDLHLKESLASQEEAKGSLATDVMNLLGGEENETENNTDTRFYYRTEINSFFYMENISRIFLQKCFQYAFPPPMTVADQEHLKGSHVEIVKSSSVDPPLLVKTDESHFPECGDAIDQKLNLDIKKILEEKSNINNDNEKTYFIPCNDRVNVDDIIKHLNETDIEFSSKISVNGEFKVKYQSGRHNETSEALANETHIKFASADFRDLGDVIEAGINDNEELAGSYNNEEICSTTYLADEGEKHYIIVGGEADCITTRRFRRRFHLSGKLKMCKIKDSNLLTSPFSVALALEKTKSRERTVPKIYVVLFTSIFIDSNTVCTFHLDRKGSVIKMTSSQFQQYASEAGMEVWFMP